VEAGSKFKEGRIVNGGGAYESFRVNGSRAIGGQGLREIPRRPIFHARRVRIVHLWSNLRLVLRTGYVEDDLGFRQRPDTAGKIPHACPWIV
jgi:hypothetical protein